MMIYSIRLSYSKNPSDFEKFMVDEIFPAVDKRSLRTGQIRKLVLLKAHNGGTGNEYLWLVEGAINGGSANQQIDKIKAFGSEVTSTVEFVERGEWSAEA